MNVHVFSPYTDKIQNVHTNGGSFCQCGFRPICYPFQDKDLRILFVYAGPTVINNI